MVAWIILVSNYNKKYNPMKSELSSLKIINVSLMQSIDSLKDYRPDIKSQESEVIFLKKELKEINKEYEKLGGLIPKKGNIDQFLKYLTYEEKAGKLLFRVITPVKESQSEKDRKKNSNSAFLGIETHIYELRIFGYYSDIYNYLRYLEKLSHFGGIIKTEVTRDVKNKTDKLEALIWFSLIISNEEVKNRETTFNILNKKRVNELKSPFLTFKKTPEAKIIAIEKALPSFEISGIISNKNENRVIINKQIYKAGDKIDESTILKIDKNKVIFETDSIKHEVSIS